MNKKRQRTEIGGENGFEEWGGYMAAKKNKLQEQFMEQAKKQDENAKSDIFKNVSVFVNGYTVPSADEIKRTMMTHGGVYHHYFSTEHTTHIIASNLPDVKIKQLKSLLVNVVKPEWITASLEAKRQVDFRPFLLYSHQSRTQPSIRSFAGSKPCAAGTSAGLDKHCSPLKDEATEENSQIDVELESNDQESNGANSNELHSPQDGERTEENSKNDVEGQESSEDLFASPEVEEAHPTTSSATSKAVPNSKDESSKPSNAARCASEPNFLSEFYNNSRLHHISTMAAMYKQLVNELRQKKNEFSGLQRLKEWKKKNGKVKNNFYDDDEEFDSSLDTNSSKSGRHNDASSSDKIIMHIDMDCFFVSVGLRRYPHLKGQPVAVTHSKGNGTVAPRNGSDRKYEFNYYKERLEAKLKTKNNSNADAVEARAAWTEGIDETSSMAEIASCSYEARKKGVKNGMFVGTALKLCPDLKVIPYDFEAYKEVANTLYHTVASYTMDIEAVSCDEMLVDCTKVLSQSNCSPLEFASFLRKEIKGKTQCPASTGFGSNRLLARLATRRAKPDGMFYLESSAVPEFMLSIDVKDLPGVGYTIASRLQAMGITTCGEMQQISAEKLNELGTKTGDLLFRQCRGDDCRPLNFDYQRKSVSAEINYGIRFKNQQEADVFVRQLSVEVQNRLTEAKVKGSSIALKLLVRAKDAPVETAKFNGHGVCDSITRSSTLPRAVSDADSIAGEVQMMLKKVNVNPSDLRGIGITISRLENAISSAGALDRFLVKNDASNRSTLFSKSPQKPDDSGSSSKGKATIPKISPKKQKVFTHKGNMGIDQFMVARKKSSRSDNVLKLPPPNDLDMEVLEALPDDIRNEVLEAYSSNSKIESGSNNNEGLAVQKELAKNPATACLNMDVTYSQVDPTFMEALPTDMRKELEADLHRRRAQKKHEKQIKFAEKNNDTQPGPSHSNDRLFCHRNKSILKSFMTPNEVKCMIRQWVSEENHPQSCDVHILEHYFCDLVQERSIEDLKIIFNLFRRCVLAQSSLVWKKKFQDILFTVQRSMQEVYHSSLLVEDI